MHKQYKKIDGSMINIIMTNTIYEKDHFTCNI